MERPTFSPFWHRIRSMKPRLRPHVQITRQHYRGRRWHVVHDPTSNQFYRLNPVAHDFVSSLDGARTVDDAWQQSLTRHGDASPTQNEIIELLSQLYSSNLLSTDAAPETAQLLTRGKERAAKRFKQQAIGLMYLRVKLFNPDPLLTFLLPIFRPFLSLWGLAAWACLIIYALVRVFSGDWTRLAAGLDSVVAPSNWGYLMVTFVALKAWHELGHGLICRRFGGQVPECGAMLLVLLPAPYVDASSCWAFPSKWQRMAVGAGGMLFELAAAAVAALIWVSTPDGALIKQICYFVMITSGVSTILFNGNPLMRFDGYFIFADLIEVPNLMQRSQKSLTWLVQRYIYGLKNQRPPSSVRSEMWILVIYGVAAMIYRVFLFIVITLYVLGLWFIVGVLLAAWTAGMWFFGPIGKFIHWLSSSSQLVDHRARAVLTSIAMAAALVVLVGLIPLPDYRRARGVIDTAGKSGVFIGTDGFVEAAHVRPGDLVKAGDPLLTLSSPELDSNENIARARLTDAVLERSEAYSKDDAPAAAVAQRKIEAAQQQLDDLTFRRSQLIVRAPRDGTVVAADPTLLVGAYITRGKPVCLIVDLTTVRITAVMNQAEAAWLFELPEADIAAEIRPVSDPFALTSVAHLRAIPAGQRDLPHESLSFAGGGEVEVRPDDPARRRMKSELFNVYLEPAMLDGVNPLASAPLGQRVHLRFALPSKPILDQLIDRINKTLQGRVNL
jgi:putative peptide zinc metalloprotease protein